MGQRLPSELLHRRTASFTHHSRTTHIRMSLRSAVAAPFQQKGRESMPESEFVVALSLDRDWFPKSTSCRAASA